VLGGIGLSVPLIDDVIRKRSFDHTFCLSELRRVPQIIALRDTVSAFALLLSGAPVFDMNSQQQRIFSLPQYQFFLCLTAKIDFFPPDSDSRLTAISIFSLPHGKNRFLST
jgi:hypothetical protein